MDIYQEYMYENREAYLRDLADDYQVPEQDVIALAELLGKEEDFDGLVIAVEDRALRLEFGGIDD
jgi:hypothetical protein